MENVVKRACIKVFIKALDESVSGSAEERKAIIKNAKASIKEFLKTAGMEDQFESIVSEAFDIW